MELDNDFIVPDPEQHDELLDMNQIEWSAVPAGANFTQHPAARSMLVRKSYDLVKGLVDLIPDEDTRGCVFNIQEYLHDHYGDDLSKHVSGSVDAVEAVLRISSYLGELQAMGVVVSEDPSWAEVRELIESSQAFNKSNTKEDEQMTLIQPAVPYERTVKFAAEDYLTKRAEALVERDMERWTTASAMALLLEKDSKCIKVYEQLCGASPYKVQDFSQLRDSVRKNADFPAELREAVQIVAEG